MTAHQLALLVAQHHAQIAEAVAILLGLASSHITALLVHVHASPAFKARVAGVLAVVAGVVASVGWDASEPWWAWVKAIFFAAAAQQIAYLLKRFTGVAAVEAVVPGGLGTPVPDVPDPSVPAPVTDPSNTAPAGDGGAGLIGLLLWIAGAICGVIGLVWLIVGAVHHVFDVGAFILLVVGIVLLVAADRAGYRVRL